jgi:hypothetical protein
MRDDGVCGVIELECQPDQFSAEVQQSFRVHRARLSHAWLRRNWNAIDAQPYQLPLWRKV